MKHHSFWPRSGSRTLVIAVAGALALTGCSGGSSSDSSGTGGGGDSDKTQLLTIPREDQATFSQNFNPFCTHCRSDDAAGDLRADAGLQPGGRHHDAVAGHEVGGGRRRNGHHLHPARRRQVVGWRSRSPPTTSCYTFELQKKLLGGFDYLDTVTAVDAHRRCQFTFNEPFSPALARDRAAGHRPGAHLVDGRRPGQVHQREAGRHRPVHRGHQLPEPVLRAAARTPTTGSRTSRRSRASGCWPSPGNDAANLAATNGDVDWAPTSSSRTSRRPSSPRTPSTGTTGSRRPAR